MRRLLHLTLVLAASLLGSEAPAPPGPSGAPARPPKPPPTSPKPTKPEPTRLEIKAREALAYATRRGMNTDLALLVDMSIHSGKRRMFVWSFAEGKAIDAGLCAHGVGGGSTRARPVFSNTPDSNCSSLGKYRVGKRAWSNWGIHAHYKLHGLEATNDNAYKRYVVLHSHTPMPAEEIYPAHLPLGWSEGCPVVSDAFMRRLDARLRRLKKPALLWIFN